MAAADALAYFSKADDDFLQSVHRLGTAAGAGRVLENGEDLNVTLGPEFR